MPNSNIHADHGSHSNLSVSHAWLFKLSLLAVVLLEILPIEAGLLHGAFQSKSIPAYLIIKSFCLAVILLPLIVFANINGLKALRERKYVLLFVGVVVLINLIMNFTVLLKIGT